MSQGRRAAEWFAEVAGKQVGPLSGGDLRQLVAAGRVHAETPIRRGSDGPWRPAGEVKGLSPGPPPEPEPEPPPAPAPSAPPAPQPGDEWHDVPEDSFSFNDEPAAAPPGTVPPGVAPGFIPEAHVRSASGSRGGTDGATPAYAALRTYSNVLRIVGYVVAALAALGILASFLLGFVAASQSGEPAAFFVATLSGLSGAIPALLTAFLLIVAAEFVMLAVNVASDVRELKDRTPRR